MNRDRVWETESEYLSFLNRFGAPAAMGVGNIYYVLKSTESFYPQFIKDKQFSYSDGSKSVHTAIQTALNKTVANRNDYVIVNPSQSDYDISAVLSLSKKVVHLLAPGGLGNRVGSTAACRIHPHSTDVPTIKLTDSSIEVAGFYFKNYSNQTILQLAQNSYACNFHNNNFVWAAASTTCVPIVTNIVSGNTLNDGGSWGSVEANWFVNSAGGSATVAVLFQIHGNAKDCRIKYNEFTLSDAITVTVGVDNQAVGAAVDFNTFRGDAAVAVWTNCINVIAAGSAIGNIGAVATGQLLSGGTAASSFSENYDGATGTRATNIES